MFDIIIRGGTIVDGSGKQGFVSDLGIEDDKITAISNLSTGKAKKTINATGLYITPGFIDSHSHADASVPMWPDMESALGQGITTCVTGHCGISLAPINKYWLEQGFESPAFDRIIPPYPGGPLPGAGRILPTDDFAQVFEETFKTALDWRSFGEFLDRLDTGIGANMVCHVGHKQLRQQVLGIDSGRAASDDELKEIGSLLRECLEAGAWGLGFGLDYFSSGDAAQNELLYLMQIVKEYDKLVTAHVQSRAIRRGKNNPRHLYGEGLIEFLELGKESGARVHISHLNSISTSPGNEPGIYLLNSKAAEASLAIIEHYRKTGIRVTWDRLCAPVIPYYYFPLLAYKFRPYADDCGGPEGFSEALNSGWYRQTLIKEIRDGNHRGKLSFVSFNFDTAGDLTCIKTTENNITGLTLSQIAEKNGKNLLESALDILSIDPYAKFHRKLVFSPETAKVFARCDDVSFGTDNGAYNYDHAQLDAPGFISHGTPSAFCQMIAYLEQDYGLSFEQMIRRLSANAAGSFGISNRGTLQEGYFADILVINKEKLCSNFNLIEPRTQPSGIEYVIVNGKIALEKGTFMSNRPGKSIRSYKSKD